MQQMQCIQKFHLNISEEGNCLEPRRGKEGELNIGRNKAGYLFILK
jgi:hypothetical protein